MATDMKKRYLASFTWLWLWSVCGASDLKEPLQQDEEESSVPDPGSDGSGSGSGGGGGGYTNATGKMPPIAYKEGPLPTISDSLFSLIILIYVSVIFICMFFSFCWREPEPPPPDPSHKNIPMITSMLEEMEKQLQENDRKNGKALFVPEDEGTEMKVIITETRSHSEQDPEALDDAFPVASTSADNNTVVVQVVTEKTKAGCTVMDEPLEEQQAATQV